MICEKTFQIIAVAALSALSSGPAFAQADMNKVLRVALPFADAGYDPQAADFFSNAVTRVIFVPFTNGKPSGEAIDVLTGFLDDQGRSHGRPVGVAIDRRGALLVADDVGNVVWRVSAAEPVVVR